MGHSLESGISIKSLSQFSMKCLGIYLPVLAFLFYMPRMFAEEAHKTPETCTYTVGIWNTGVGAITRTVRVEKPYSEITEEEKDPFVMDCTACSEDQVLIKLPGLDSFSVCRVIAAKVEAGLQNLISRGEPILTVSGYRPVQSKGPLNESGERTVLSNHAFGTAIDINRMQNGLYRNCYEWNAGCELVLGGPWRPGKTRGSLSPDGAVVRKMKSLGFKWGGEIEASQKDFMHFSLSGF
jgi:hypothetical protein